MSRPDDEIAFQIHLPSLIDCLGMFGHQTGSAPVLCLKYLEDEPLKMWLEEAGVVIEINARTRLAQDTIDFDFSHSEMACKVSICLARR